MIDSPVFFWGNWVDLIGKYPRCFLTHMCMRTVKQNNLSAWMNLPYLFLFFLKTKSEMITEGVGQVVLAWDLDICSILRSQVWFFLSIILEATSPLRIRVWNGYGGAAEISSRCAQVSPIHTVLKNKKDKCQRCGWGLRHDKFVEPFD